MFPKIFKNLPLFLILVSFIPWLLILALPFTGIDLATKAIAVPFLLVLAEILFWVGIAIAGKEAAQRYRRYFNPKVLWQKFARWFAKWQRDRKE